VTIALGVGIRLAAIAAAGPPERFEYDDLARNLISGRGFVYDQLGTPYRSFYAGLGYVAINAATDWIFPNAPKAMVVVQSLYAGVLALVVFAIARQFFDERMGVVAAALVLLHPSLFYYDTRKLHPLGFDSLSMMAAVWLLLRLRDDRRVWVAMASGMVFGLSIFQRGSMALFLGVALIWISAFTGVPARRVGVAAAYLGGVLLIVAPWVARNYAIHRLVLLESMTAQQFWKGNATYSNGSGYLAEGRNVYDAAPERLVEEWRRRDETGQVKLFSEEGAAEVRKDPSRAAGLMLRKLVYFWTVPPNSGQQYPAKYFAAYLGYYVVLLAAASAGLVVAWHQPALRPGVILVLAYFASLSIVHAIMFVEMRHRWATEPLMLAFAPAGALAIWRRWSRTQG
jgi:4-amino-4-deoxy-L-arabinose transferase-like glycosyltransferase